MNASPSQKALILFGLACLGLVVYLILDSNGILPALQDGEAIQSYIKSLGMLGPIMIIVLMTLAILISPLPSAPIAIAAGAVYGHTWGTIFVLAGSLTGATGAFFIARYLGYEFIKKLTEDYLALKFLRSQHALMGIVFASRLMPFLSFDVISYAAGLSPLVFWRFGIATLFGIAPASFLLAHVGSEMASTELNRIAMAIFLLTTLTAISLFIKLLRKKHPSDKQ
ncbi:TVP38/TMEM64 family protein [Kaarinaea lacus]